VPIVFALAALLFPMLMLLAFNDARRPPGEFGAVGLSWNYREEWLLFNATIFSGAILASPVAGMAALGEAPLDRLRRFARRLTPMLVMLTAGLVALAVIRSARYPVIEHWAETLPVHAVTPSWRDVPCDPLPAHAHQHVYDVGECVTPEVEAASPLSFHYHCRDRGGQRVCELHYRIDGGVERSHSMQPLSPIHRDDVLGVYVKQGANGSAYTLGRFAYLTPSLLSDRIAPPLGWIIAAACGLAFAALASLTWRAVRRLATAQGASAFVERLRGDLAIVSTAVLLTTGSYLFTALAVGLLTPR
jgi:hypothetical protein